MSHRRLIMIAATVAIVLLIIVFIVRRISRAKTHRRTLDKVAFNKRWKELQKNCATRKTWPKAIIAADDLLDDALKQSNYKGKTTGERLVAAQHKLTANEEVWFSHKMRDIVANEDVRRLKKQDIVDALSGFRQALKDLGALEQ